MEKPVRSSFQYLSISYECALAIGNSLNLSEMLHKVIYTMVHKTNAHRGIIWVRNGEQELQPLVSAGINIEDVPVHGEIKDFRDVLNQIQKSRQFVLRYKNDKDFLQYCPVLTEKEKSVLIVPVNNVAIIHLVYAGREIADEPLANLLAGLSKKLSLAIEACMAHKNIINEVQVRLEAEEELKKKTEQLISGEKESHRLYEESEQARKSLLSIMEDVMQKEEALRESEEKYRTLTENMSDIVYSLNGNGILTYISPQINQYGIAPETLISRNLLEIIHPEDRENIVKEYQLSVETGEEFPSTFRVLDAKGGVHWFEDIGKIQRDKDGNITGIAGVLRDITERKKAEEAIHKSEEKYRLLADNSIDITWQTDLKLVFTYASPSIENFSGYTVDEWVGTRLSQHATTKEFFKIARKALYAVKHYKKFKHLTFEAVMLRKDGTDIPVEITGKLLLNKKGFPIGLQGITRNITERKQAEEALREKEAYARAIFEQSPISIQIFDKTGLTIDTNKAWGELWQLPSDELIGKYNVLEDKYAREIGGLYNIEKAFEGETSSLFEIEYDPVKSGNPGRKRTLKCVVFPIENKTGEVDRVVLMHEDITESKKAEEELKKYREHLEKLVQERTAELEEKTKRITESQRAMSFLLEDVNEARKDLETANEHLTYTNKELESFSYSVSHDLRAPLRAIRGFSAKLEDALAGTLDDEGKRLLQIIRDNTLKMGSLIDDLLTFSRIGRVELFYSKIELAKLVRSIEPDILVHFPEQRVKLETGILPPVPGDRRLIEQVLINLISNAIKFSKKQNVSKIKVGFREIDGEQVYFIKDNGVGFDMKYAHKIFDVFQRLHTEREFEGTGVGLAIVKRIIQRHGGRIWAESKPGKGATFFFTLPERNDREGGRDSRQNISGMTGLLE